MRRNNRRFCAVSLPRDNITNGHAPSSRDCGACAHIAACLRLPPPLSSSSPLLGGGTTRRVALLAFCACKGQRQSGRAAERQRVTRGRLCASAFPRSAARPLCPCPFNAALGQRGKTFVVHPPRGESGRRRLIGLLHRHWHKNDDHRRSSCRRTSDVGREERINLKNYGMYIYFCTYP